MLILCYGITKSGSTLAFELVKGMLESIGQEQTQLPDDVVASGRRINFTESIDEASVTRMFAAIPENRLIAVKTHRAINRAMFMWLEELQAERKLQIIASYRDPRDICLSLVDAGARAREMGLQAFSEFTDLASTIPAVERGLFSFRKWASIRGALRLDYDVVAFSADRAIDAIEGALGIVCDRNLAKKYAFDDAFTQKNKAVAQRHAVELSKEQNDDLLKVFGQFIRRVCVKNNDSWFSAFRERFIANAGAENA